FRLDRGAQVLAVGPQPVTRAPNGTLTQASNQIVVHFDDQLLNRADAENPKFFRLVDTRATLDTSDDQTRLPQTAQYDATDNTVTLTFASALPEGTYRLDIGLSDGGSATPGTAIRIGTLFNENHFSHNGYLGDDSEVAGGESQPDFYRVELTAGANLRIELTQHEPALNASARLIDANQHALTLTSLGAGIWGYTVPAGAAGDYYIEVSSSDGSSGSYRI